MNSEQRQEMIRARKQETGDTERLWVRDEYMKLPITTVPVSALLLNIENRRFQAERMKFEEEMGRTLDPESNPRDEKSIQAILLDTNLSVEDDMVVGTEQEETKALKADWLARKQERPIWIRPDGTVRNGNRRLAMVKRLQGKGGVAGHDFIQAVIMATSQIDEQTLFQMEQREQLTTDFKVQYSDVNRLLALRAAAIGENIDWNDEKSLDEVAEKLQKAAGGAKGAKVYALTQLRGIKFMDEYLDDSGVAGQYQKARKQVERFRDAGKIMKFVQEDYSDQATEVMRLLFAAVRAGNEHGDIREFKKIVRDGERFDALTKQVKSLEEKWRQRPSGGIESPKVVADQDDEDGDQPSPVVPGYPQEEVKTAIKNTIDAIRVMNLDVLSKLVQAWSRLEPLAKNKDRMIKELDELQAANQERAKTMIKNIRDFVEIIHEKVSK